MKTYIILNLPDFEHVEPTFPFVKELTRRGHIVIYYTAEAYQAKVESVGAEFRIYPIEIKDYLKAYHEGHLSKELKTKYKILEASLSEDIKKERPAAILYDADLYFAKLIGKKMKVPTISLVANLVQLTSKIDCFSEKSTGFKKILAHFKEKKVNTTFEMVKEHTPYSNLNFVYTFMDFQPYATLLDTSFQYVGYPLAEIEENVLTYDLPKTVIYVTFSPEFSYLNEVIDILKNIFCDSEETVIIQSHLKLDPRILPPNFKIVTDELSFSDFSKLSCMVTDGGIKHTHQSLKHKVPTLMIPQTAEQQRLAKRIEECMMGLTVEQINEAVIQDSLECILSDAKFVANAKLMGSRFQVLGGVGKMVYQLEQFIEKN